MKRWGRWLGMGIPAAALLAVSANLLTARDPAYRLASWVALGRYGRHDAAIRQAALRYAVEADLLKALAWQASRFEAKKTGAAGERGLLQIAEPLAREWAAAERIETFMFTDLFDVDTNLRIGAWALRRALAHGWNLDAPETCALVEFRVGRAQAQTWAQGTNSSREFLANADASTRAFVREVIARRDYYKAQGW